ncbi:pyridoxamine 5'-phosphate oxidase family protein [Hydrogenophaga sp. PAMC20947]|uniref:pyridoxamine 5'-phosphate oxidase family protein n=1 Tax=Hydrogenophaga sp. PAMC20947 TaxID=2565558 RepID=UPI00109DA8ED|nr:pyridoxamine 5'-phosphate oxidase family protein [Hydrogenophaga sp. PAMC20947]QCB48125.1 hypothetical protein E5678_20100 [Hydrogenophaga sp. PAMC20947]
MSTTEHPDHDLPHCLWRELDHAVTQRGHAWRTPVLATTDTLGMPQARTVVLRAVDAGALQLRIYTDRRSAKVAELQGQAMASLVFWSSELQWQLRVSARFEVMTQGDEVNSAWERVRQTASAADYLTPASPGSERPAVAPGEGRAGTPHHLAVLMAQVESMDWLALSRAGHQRARWQGGQLSWLVP